jgi:hypothetical protein
VFLTRGEVDHIRANCSYRNDVRAWVRPWRQEVETQGNVRGGGVGRKYATSYDGMLLLRLFPSFCYCPLSFWSYSLSCFLACASSYSSNSSTSYFHSALFCSLLCLSFFVFYKPFRLLLLGLIFHFFQSSTFYSPYYIPPPLVSSTQRLGSSSKACYLLTFGRRPV